jgi:hypothetical protein
LFRSSVKSIYCYTGRVGKLCLGVLTSIHINWNFIVVMQCAHFNEMKDALLDAIGEITKTLFQLKKASEEYYFLDKEHISLRVSHDVYVDMQKMA